MKKESNKDIEFQIYVSEGLYTLEKLESLLEKARRYHALYVKQRSEAASWGKYKPVKTYSGGKPNYVTEPEEWEKFCDKNCTMYDHHKDCEITKRMSK